MTTFTERLKQMVKKVILLTEKFNDEQRNRTGKVSAVRVFLNAHVLITAYPLVLLLVVLVSAQLISSVWHGNLRPISPLHVVSQVAQGWSLGVIGATLYVAACAPPLAVKPSVSMLGVHWKGIASFGKTATLLAVGAGAGVYAQDAASSAVVKLLLRPTSPLTPYVAATFFIFFSVWAVAVVCVLYLGFKLTKDMARLERWGRFECTAPTRRRERHGFFGLPNLPVIGRYWMMQLSHPGAAMIAYPFAAWNLVGALLVALLWTDTPFPVLL